MSELDIGPAEGFQPDPTVGRRCPGLGQALLKQAQPRRDDLLQQRMLAVEVGIQRRLRHAGGLGDHPGRHRIEPPFSEQPCGDFEDFIAPGLARRAWQWRLPLDGSFGPYH